MSTSIYRETRWYSYIVLTHRGRVTHICVGNSTIIVSDNGLSPYRRQAIIWTNAGILLIGPLGTNLSEILIEILTFSFMKMRLKVSSAKRRPFCLGLNVLTHSRDCTSAEQPPLWEEDDIILDMLSLVINGNIHIDLLAGNYISIYYIHAIFYSCTLSNWTKLFRRDIHTKSWCGHDGVLDDMILVFLPV